MNTDTTRWQGLVYQLLYPGILGSMLYDIFDLSQPATARWWGKLGVVLLYCVDYLHLYGDLRTATRHARPSQLIVDTVAALLFRGVFSAVGVGAPFVAVALMAFIAILFTAYNLRRGIDIALWYLIGVGWLMLSTLVIGYAKVRQMELFLAAMAITLVLYGTYVFRLFRRRRSA